MLRYLIDWVLNTVSPPNDHCYVVDVPSETLEYIAWLVDQTRHVNITELGLTDYVEDLTIRVMSLERIFYHIDVSLNYLDPLRDSGEVEYPTQPVTLSLIEFRHNCNRIYPEFSDLVEMFNKKSMTLYNKLNSIDESEVGYYKKRWKGLLSDIISIYECLLIREGVL